MAAYWSTLAYQSLFEPSRFFGRQFAEGASAKLRKVLAFVADEMRPLPANPPAGPSTDGEAS
jgi:hypothetical protein